MNENGSINPDGVVPELIVEDGIRINLLNKKVSQIPKEFVKEGGKNE